MLWNDLKSKKIGIWGIDGKEGSAAFRALSRFVPTAQIIDIDESKLNRIYACDIIIKSPGVSLYRNEIQNAQARNIQFVSGSSLFMANKRPQTQVIGITGTKGKSTTSALLYHVLQTANINASFGGNIGKPLLDFLSDETSNPPDIIVAELSSYQCADFDGICDMAILTNLFPEHLQWHRSHKQYYLDKCHMIQQAETAFVNGANQIISTHLPILSKASFFNTHDTFHLQDKFFYHRQQKLFPCSDLHLVGEHNAENACAVLSVANKLNIQFNIIQQAFKTFKPLPHRLQIIGTFHGITFVDDSISTTPETALAAVQSFDKGQFITLILGGYDRGQNYEKMIQILSNYRSRLHLITLPDTGVRIFKAAQSADISATTVQTMAEAVSTAYQITPTGGTVLLSPASPSYNAYRHFEERGLDFQKQIALQKKATHTNPSPIYKKTS